MNLVVGYRNAIHPRGRNRTIVSTVIYRYKGRVRVAHWHLRYLTEAHHSRTRLYRVMSDWVNAAGNYWQFEFETLDEVEQFFKHMAQNYN